MTGYCDLKPPWLHDKPRQTDVQHVFGTQPRWLKCPVTSPADGALNSIVRRHAVFRAFLLALSALYAAVPACATSSCDSANHSEIISPQVDRLAPASFEDVRLEMTMWEIVQLLGPAHRELGSGLMILGWESTDGPVFLVGGTSMCKPPIYARFDLVAPSNESCMDDSCK